MRPRRPNKPTKHPAWPGSPSRPEKWLLGPARGLKHPVMSPTRTPLTPQSVLVYHAHMIWQRRRSHP